MNPCKQHEDYIKHQQDTIKQMWEEGSKLMQQNNELMLQNEKFREAGLALEKNYYTLFAEHQHLINIIKNDIQNVEQLNALRTHLSPPTPMSKNIGKVFRNVVRLKRLAKHWRSKAKMIAKEKNKTKSVTKNRGYDHFARVWKKDIQPNYKNLTANNAYRQALSSNNTQKKLMDKLTQKGIPVKKLRILFHPDKYNIKSGKKMEYLFQKISQ